MNKLSTAPAQIILVGPMGVGKTTIGQQLAAALDYEFIDSDREIESRTGANIPLIFELEGEEGFRKRESAVIQELVSRSGIVLATGGGAVIRPENQAAIRTAALVIYLTANIDTLLDRTSRDKGRPLLQTDNPRETLSKIMSERQPAYRAVADIEIRTDTRPTQEITRRIMKKIKSQPTSETPLNT